MEAKEKVLKLIDQVVQELDGLNSVEVRVVITGVLNEMNMPQIPILILGDMANVMKSNQIVMTEDEGGWHVAFGISNDCEEKDSERSDEDKAPIYQQAPEGADMEKIEKEVSSVHFSATTETERKLLRTCTSPSALSPARLRSMASRMK